MLQKLACRYTASLSKFKSDPEAALKEADGEAIAVTSQDETRFYAVPAHLYEEMVKYLEIFQRGSSELKEIQAEFGLTDETFEKLSKNVEERAREDKDGYTEC